MELECGYSPEHKTINLIFFGPPAQPRPRLLLENNPGKSSAVRRSCFLPHSTDIDYKLLHTHTHMHSLSLPRSLASVALNRQPDGRVCGQRREWLRDRMAACWSWITSPVAKSCAYGLCAFCCWGVFPVLTLYSPRSIVWGLFFFSSLSSSYAVIFFNSLSSCPVYPLVVYVCCVCMDRLMAYFTGTCD